MQRLTTIIFTVIASFFFQTTHARIEEPITSPPDIQKIQERGTLIVALYDKDMPPFFMRDADGKLIGYDVNLAENMASALGVKVEFRRTANTFDGVVDEVAKGNADIAISLLSITLPRALKVDFSNPYAYPPQALLYNRLAAAQKHYSNVTQDIVNDPNITLGVLEKSSHIEYAHRNYPHAKIILYTDVGQGMQDVRNNKLFCFYFNEIEIKNWLEKQPDANLYVNYQKINYMRDPIGIAVSWHEPHLLNWINWFLLVNEQNGVFRKLQQRYFLDNNEKNKLKS